MTHGTAADPPPREPRSLTALLRDERVIQVLVQLLFVAVVLWVAFILYQNMANALGKQGLRLGFGFLNQVSGFDISIEFLPHTRASSNLTAIQVGLINTLVASILSIILSTILGVIVGIMRISNNYLVNRAAWLYIEIFRNVPLLLVIIASYAVIVYNLPNVKESIVLPGPSYLSNRGLYLPLPRTTPTTTTYLVLLAVFLAVAVVMARFIMRRYRLDSFLGTLIALGILLVLGVAAWFAFPVPPFVLEVPELTGLNYTGGLSFPPEFVGIVVGLTLGSAPFTADTVRAGLQSVTAEQIRAAHALGLNGYLTLRLVIFPQAMRVIVPPMTSNYLSLIKNSSLASVIAFPEIVHISSTITSQTGRAVEMMFLLMVIYSTLSLLTSLFMNWFNNRVKIVER
jgi:general L-amino acid transport system permease protein